MDFKEFLIKKKIDPDKFESGDPARWEEFSQLFGQMHHTSFTSQKLYLINTIRRKFPLS
jgi:hypothetical protein